jgi:hypothetical protein
VEQALRRRPIRIAMNCLGTPDLATAFVVVADCAVASKKIQVIKTA